MLFDIVFQSGEFINPDSSWGLDLLNTILGATIGSAATLGALYFTLQYDRKKEAKKQKQFQLEKIKYLKSLIGNTISDLKAQTEFVKNLSEAVVKDPLNLPLLEIRTFNDLERLVHKVNQEEYYHSYLGQYGSSDENIEEFRKIYALLDFFYASVNSIKDMYKNSQSYDYERKIKYKELFEIMMDYVAVDVLRGSTLVNHAELNEFINNAVVNFYKGATDRPDMKYAYENFVEILKPGIVKYGQEISQINNLLVQLKNITVLYSDIQNQNMFMAESFKEQHKYINENLAKFQELTKRLVNYKET